MLRKAGKPFWRRVRELLAKPRRRRIAVNLSKLERYAKEGSTVIVPGKVLAGGSLTKPIRVAAFSFSQRAKQLIEAAGGKALSIEELVEKEKDNVSEFNIII